MNLTKEEKEYLINHLNGEKTWYEGQVRVNGLQIFSERLEIVNSILKKIETHPLKLKLSKDGTDIIS